MKILLISQVFWPDTASTSQHLSDLAQRLSIGNEVRVITSRHDYENNRKKYARYEEWNRIKITRINNTSFGKTNTLSRVMDFFSFNFLLFFKLCFISRKNTDLIVGLTSPPLVSFIGAWFAKRRRISFHYWTMDLQPELSISSGLIKEGSLAARLFTMMGNYVFKNADKIIALDKYMAEYAVKRGAASEKVHVVPVWPVMEEVYEGTHADNPFRISNGFGNRIVVMYSGNHSFIHPLDTLLETALRLKEDKRFVFVFIGGGVRAKEVTQFKNKHQLDTVVQLKYQPRNQIHLSLGAADIQVVILGEEQIGFTHPNKIYGAMFIGKPILYIGPADSHITDIINKEQGNILVQHNDVQSLTDQLIGFAGKSREKHNEIGHHNMTIAIMRFHPDLLKDKMVEIITDQILN